MKKRKCKSKGAKPDCKAIKNTTPPISALPIIRMQAGKNYNLIVLLGRKRFAQKIIRIDELSTGFVQGQFQDGEITVNVKINQLDHEIYSRFTNEPLQKNARGKHVSPSTGKKSIRKTTR